MEERSPARSPVSFASGYADAPAPLLVCFSHLRWDFVWQRPQHLLSRAAKHYRVLQIEEPLFEKGARPRMDVSKRPGGIAIATPVLPEGLSERDVTAWQRRLIDRLLAREPESPRILWYYTPMAMAFTQPSRLRSLRLRQHGRALAFPRRLAGDDRQRGRAVPARRRRLHRRHEPLRGEAQPAPQRARLPVLDRLRPFREGASRRRSRALRPGGDPASAARLLRRHRRAHGHRSRRRRRRSEARLAPRHDRTGGEDRPCDPAAARQHPLARRQELFGPAALPLWLGRRLHAVRA